MLCCGHFSNAIACMLEAVDVQVTWLASFLWYFRPAVSFVTGVAMPMLTRSSVRSTAIICNDGTRRAGQMQGE